MTGSLSSLSIGSSASRARTIALIGRYPESVRALEGYLCDAGTSSTRLSVARLEQLLHLDVQGAVVFARGSSLCDLLPTLKAIHLQRPDLALVFVGGHAERLALWHAFAGAPLPPLVLRESAPAAVIGDALRIACDSSAIEHMGRPLRSPDSLVVLEAAVSQVVSMLTENEPLRDHSFDRLLPMRLRAASDQFWTPLDVVKRAVSWFEELNVGSVVDIGSGVGKFCVVGALLGTASFIGIEQRPQLTTVARNLSRLFGVEHRVSLIDGKFGEVRTPVADCYYLYNPFEENLFPASEALDNEVELTAERFRHDLRCFRALVVSLPIGAHILTYNGVGGHLPDCLDEVRVDRELPAALRLLRKVRRHRSLTALSAGRQS